MHHSLQGRGAAPGWEWPSLGSGQSLALFWAMPWPLQDLPAAGAALDPTARGGGRGGAGHSVHCCLPRGAPGLCQALLAPECRPWGAEDQCCALDSGQADAGGKILPCCLWRDLELDWLPAGAAESPSAPQLPLRASTDGLHGAIPLPARGGAGDCR